MNKEKIIANMATFPPRINILKRSVASLIPQVDKLNIYLNNYTEVPDFLLKEKKVNAILSKDAAGDLKDNGKFFFLNDAPEDCYYLTVDDDINYPENYTKTLVEKCTSFNNNFLIGVHGVIFHRNFSSFHNTRTNFYFENKLENDVFTSILGTGTIIFNKKTFQNLSLSDFKTVGMADIWLSIYCKRNDIPLLCMARKQHWLKNLTNSNDYSLWEQSAKNDEAQNKLIKENKLWELRENEVAPYINYLEKKAIKEDGLLEEIILLKEELRTLKQENKKILKSKSLAIGNLFFRSIKNPIKIITFPINLTAILLNKKRGEVRIKEENALFYCPLCNKKTFFRDFGNPPRRLAQCSTCGSLERHRFLFYLYKIIFLNNNRKIKLLHMAPEECFYKTFSNNKNIDYVAADIDPNNYSFVEKCEKEDFTKLSFLDNVFDIILSNHVLEHIKDEVRYLTEMKRCLKDDGIIILSIPMNKSAGETFEDSNVKTKEERKLKYGQEDHVRIYGLDIIDRLENHGFLVENLDPNIFSDEIKNSHRFPIKNKLTSMSDGFFILRKNLS